MTGHTEVVEYLQELLGRVLKDKPVAAAYLYGSAARGEMTPLSDVDIGLLIRSPLSLLEKLDRELAVEVELASLGCGRSEVRGEIGHHRLEDLRRDGGAGCSRARCGS